MNVSVLIATYGDDHWEEMARSRAFPSAVAQTRESPQTRNVYRLHEPDATIAQVRNGLAEKMERWGELEDWLLFLDADDELAPGYLDAMRAAYDREREYDRGPFLLTPAVQQVRKGRPRTPMFYPEVDLRVANWLVVGTLIERDLFMRCGGFSDYPHGFEDWSLWNKATQLGAKVVKVPKAIYIQHVNPQSKHRQGWRDRRWQVETHQRVEKELAAWSP